MTVDGLVAVWAVIGPIVTLLIGVWVARGGRLFEARREAGDSLAELGRLVWAKGHDDDWLNLTEQLGRTAVRLRLAGVPPRVVTGLHDAAVYFWHELEDTGIDEIGWTVGEPATTLFNRYMGAAVTSLEPSWRVIRRRKAVANLPQVPGNS